MNGILGMAQVLLMPGIKEAERLDYARTILTSGQTLLKLLNDILDLAKIEAGKIEIEAIEFSPALILRQACSLFAHSAQAKGLQIESEWLGPKLAYRGDPHRLSQMLANLVSNAIKFSDEGSIRIQAREVSCTADQATLEFSVSDNGIGIAPDKLGLLFQNFSQVDSSTSRHFGGTGLGLSIVRTLAQLMGGQVGVHSEPGRGSRFWFRIRSHRLAGLATDEPASQSFTPGANADSKHAARVLLVEDNVDHSRLIQLLLTRLGAEVIVARDGQQGCDAVFNGESAQLILMDLHLPLLDGYAATAQIREWEQRSGQSRRAIVALTADAFEDDREHCLAVGMDEVLTKPVSLDTLQATLSHWLRAAPPVTPKAAYKAFDPDRVRSLIEEIEPLLVNHQFDAITRFRDLQEAVADTELAPAIAQAGQALHEFRFAVTLEQLRIIMTAQGWQGESRG
jgi:CheY-like chemotaxis protein